MLKCIENTELELDETSGYILDYYLSEKLENKEAFAKRLWDCCKRKSVGEKLPSVYETQIGQTWQQRAKELWEEKKRARKEAIMRELKIEEKDLENVKNHPKYRKRS